MPRTKILEFQPGDVVYYKDKTCPYEESFFLVMSRKEEENVWRYSYSVMNIYTNEMTSIHYSINNKNYKIVR